VNAMGFSEFIMGIEKWWLMLEYFIFFKLCLLIFFLMMNAMGLGEFIMTIEKWPVAHVRIFYIF
jgi:hypothetical protein